MKEQIAVALGRSGDRYMDQEIKDKIKQRIPAVLLAPMKKIHSAGYFVLHGGLIFWLWGKCFPITFLHTSDLLLPGPDGLTGMQFGVITRLMDTERWEQGRKLYWHTRSMELEGASREKLENFERQYMFFLSEISKNGMCPYISRWKLGQTPRMGQVDGTHRMGYLLFRQKNSWIPIKICPPYVMSWHLVNGEEFFRKRGQGEEEISQVNTRYRKLRDEIRTEFCGVLDYELFEQNRGVFGEILGCYCTKMFSEGEYSLHDFWQIVRKIQNTYQDRSGLCLAWSLAKLHMVRKSEKVVLLKFDLRYQDLYYKRGRLRSRVVDLMEQKIHERFGTSWGYLASTISESVLMEHCFEELHANFPL